MVTPSAAAKSKTLCCCETISRYLKLFDILLPWLLLRLSDRQHLADREVANVGRCHELGLKRGGRDSQGQAFVHKKSFVYANQRCRPRLLQHKRFRAVHWTVERKTDLCCSLQELTRSFSVLFLAYHRSQKSFDPCGRTHCKDHQR